MTRDYQDLYTQDIGDPGGSDSTVLAATGNIEIATASSKYRPPGYREKIPKGGTRPKQYKKAGVKKNALARPDNPEFYNPAGG